MGTAAPAKQSATVRISELSRHRLREMDTAYAAIQNDPEALTAEKADFKLWEVTLIDGLAPNKNRLPDLPGLGIRVF